MILPKIINNNRPRSLSFLGSSGGWETEAAATEGLAKPLLARQLMESPRSSNSRRERVSVCIPAGVLQAASARNQAPPPPPPLPPAGVPAECLTKGCLAWVCTCVLKSHGPRAGRTESVCGALACHRVTHRTMGCWLALRRVSYINLKTYKYITLCDYLWNKVKHIIIFIVSRN